MKKIMLIEDDENISLMIEKNLMAWGYEVENVKDFECVMDYFNAPDLLIIDIKLPYYDGYHWLRKIREVSDCPIIFLSSLSFNNKIITKM